MSLSTGELRLASAAYARLNGRSRNAFFAPFIGLIPSTPSILKIIQDPHASHRTVAIFSALLGLAWGASIMATMAISRQRKRDQELVDHFERRFPDDCPWKEDERILAQAEDIRLRAKTSALIHNATL
jgi:hypothetical protein